MNLSPIHKIISKLTGINMYMAAGSAFADGTHPNYIPDEQHAFLAVVWCRESAFEKRIFDALQKNGWRSPQIDHWKLLELTREHPEPALTRAMHSAMQGKVGLVIYTNN